MSASKPGFHDLLRKVEEQHAPTEARRSADDSEGEYSAFANGRVGTRPQQTVFFRKVDGSGKAFSYSYLYSIEFENMSSGFTLAFCQTQVVVSGRNLEKLVSFIAQHRAASIVEFDRGQVFECGEADPVIESIRFEKS